jgi:hypothetical protein
MCHALVPTYTEYAVQEADTGGRCVVAATDTEGSKHRRWRYHQELQGQGRGLRYGYWGMARGRARRYLHGRQMIVFRRLTTCAVIDRHRCM